MTRTRRNRWLVRLRGIAPSLVLWRAAGVIVGVAIAGGAAAGVAWYRGAAFEAVQAHPYFRVDRVVVRGVGSLVGVDEIRQWLGFHEGQSLWSADVRHIEERVEEHPMIRAASVRRVFPSTLEIRALEHRPAAIAVLDDLYYLDRRGVSFGPLGPDHRRDFPVFTGLADGGDGQRRSALRRALHLLRRVAGRAGSVEVSEMHLDPEEGLILFPTEPRVPVYLGWRSWESRLRRAERVLVTWKGAEARLARVDLRYRDQVVVSLRDQPPLSAGAAQHGQVST